MVISIYFHYAQVDCVVSDHKSVKHCDARWFVYEHCAHWTWVNGKKTKYYLSLFVRIYTASIKYRISFGPKVSIFVWLKQPLYMFFRLLSSYMPDLRIIKDARLLRKSTKHLSKRPFLFTETFSFFFRFVCCSR